MHAPEQDTGHQIYTEMIRFVMGMCSHKTFQFFVVVIVVDGGGGGGGLAEADDR